MSPEFWLTFMFVMFWIYVINATGQCHENEHSIGRMFLRGHTFKTLRVGFPEECYLWCEKEIRCQSYNFVIGQNICELNNRTKEARPEDFAPDWKKFYMKRSQNRGRLLPHNCTDNELCHWAINSSKPDIIKFKRQLGGQSDMVWCYSGLKIFLAKKLRLINSYCSKPGSLLILSQYSFFKKNFFKKFWN